MNGPRRVMKKLQSAWLDEATRLSEGLVNVTISRDDCRDDGCCTDDDCSSGLIALHIEGWDVSGLPKLPPAVVQVDYDLGLVRVSSFNEDVLAGVLAHFGASGWSAVRCAAGTLGGIQIRVRR